MVTVPGAFKKLKTASKKLAGAGLKTMGYTAKGIGSIANFGSNFYDVAKIGAKGITDLLIPGVASFGGTTGKIANTFGNLYKGEMEAHKNYISTTGGMWNTVGDWLINKGNLFAN